MTRVIVYPADEGGCGHYRIRWPAEALIAEGADVEIVAASDPEDRQLRALMQRQGDGSSRALSVELPDCDVIVLQRPLTDVLATSIPLVQAKGIRVVVEIDDDFDAVSPRNVSWRVVQPHLSPRRNRDWLRQACEQADLVVCSTPALAARYGRHGRVRVVPNHVPASYLRVRESWVDPHDGVWLGWSGSIETHPDDLQQCGPAVARALRATGAEFAVIGTGRNVARVLGLPAAPPASGWVPLSQYPMAVAQLDVGIVPLEPSAFNEAKSWLKGLEMAALGVPFVASPTGPYRQLHELGAGVLAGKPKIWERELKRLLGSAEARAELAGRGVEVASGLTIEAHCGRWWEAWTAPVNTRCAA